MVKLGHLKFIQHENVNIEVPHELAFEDVKLAPVDDVSIQGVKDLYHTRASEISSILSCEQG